MVGGPREISWRTVRITCAFCGEKGNFKLAFHDGKKKPNSDKRLNFEVYKCELSGEATTADSSPVGRVKKPRR
jgi:hypothetical protein